MGIERYDDTDLPGLVLETVPPKGTSVNLDSKITVVISSFQGNYDGSNNTSSNDDWNIE